MTQTLDADIRNTQFAGARAAAAPTSRAGVSKFGTFAITFGIAFGIAIDKVACDGGIGGGAEECSSNTREGMTELATGSSSNAPKAVSQIR